MTPTEQEKLSQEAQAALDANPPDYSKACDLAGQVLSVDPGQDQAKRVYFDALYKWSDILHAENPVLYATHCEEAVKIPSPTPTGLLLMAKNAASKEDAVRYAEDALKADGELAAAYYELGVIYYDNNDRDQAMKNLNLAIDKASQKSLKDERLLADCLFRKGRVYYMCDDELDEALKQYDEALKHDPKHFWSTRSQAVIYEVRGEYQKSIIYYEKAKELVKTTDERADVELGIAIAYENTGRKTKALELYREIVGYNQKFVFAFHNLAIILENFGIYKESVFYWKKTLEIYRKDYESSDFKGQDKTYYAFYYPSALLVCKRDKSETDFEYIEQLFVKALDRIPDKPLVILALCRFYVEKRRAMKEGEIYRRYYSAEWRAYYDDAQYNLTYYFKKGLEMIKEQLDDPSKEREYKFLHLKKGELYLLAGQYEQAQESYAEALKIDKSFEKAIEGLAIACYRSGDYPNSIKHFKMLMTNNPDDPDTEANLADAYRQAGSLKTAENIYLRLLNMRPTHVDVMIGLGECYKSMGEEAVEKNDNSTAEEYFIKARDLFNKIFAQDGEDYVSKQMKNGERMALWYSLGYVKVRLYEIGTGLDYALLIGAKSAFNHIPQGFDEYIKAQKAIKLINKRLFSVTSSGKLIPSMIFMLSFLIFAGTQYVIIRNYYKTKTVYSLNTKKANDYISQLPGNKDPASMLLTVKTIGEAESISDLTEKLEKSLPTVYPELENMVEPKVVTDSQSFNGVSYGFFTFGSLLFMVVGLFLPLITKLKVGALEMDKNTVDTINRSTKILIGT